MLTVWETWFLYLLIYSFAGWIYESAVCSMAEKRLVNRGFLNGPVCPIYGVGAVSVILVLSPLRDCLPALFFASAILTTALEYVTSWLMEALFHARWWDYSNRFLNLHGRVCLKSFLAFGALSVAVVRYIHPWVEKMVASNAFPTLERLCPLFLACFLIDLFVTLKAILHLTERLRQLKLALDSHLPDIHWPGGFQLRRLMDAFPHLTFLRYSEQWKALLLHYGKKCPRPALRRNRRKAAGQVAKKPAEEKTV